jgi:hypothetical protein
MGVPGRGFDLEDALLNGQNRNVKRSAAQVENENVALAGGALLLVQAVGDGGGGGLVDNAEHVEAGDNAGILGNKRRVVRLNTLQLLLHNCSTLRMHGRPFQDQSGFSSGRRPNLYQAQK